MKEVLHTDRSNIPSEFRSFLESEVDPIIREVHAKGGATLSQHTFKFQGEEREAVFFYSAVIFLRNTFVRATFSSLLNGTIQRLKQDGEPESGIHVGYWDTTVENLKKVVQAG